MLSQLMVLFGFFALVLVSVYWINQAVRLFDRLIGDGQSAMVFLEFTALTLPNVIRLVLPMSAFAGAVYVTNRLSSESELTVMQATGFSPWRLARPVMIYGIIIGLMMAILTNFLVPASQAQLKLRETEISRNVTARLLTEGTFLHPADGVTFYIREITPEGALNDVFLSDWRSQDRSVTYTAAQAYLVKDNDVVKMVMVDGLAQSFSREGNRLFTTNFTDFAYDISALIGSGDPHVRHIRAIPTLEILRNPTAIATETGETMGRLADHLHSRFNQPLLCMVAALIGFASLLVGGFSRFGVWRQIVGALLLLVLVKLVEGLTTEPVRDNPDLWPLIYAPSITGLIIVWALLYWAAHPIIRRQKPVQNSAPGGKAPA